MDNLTKINYDSLASMHENRKIMTVNNIMYTLAVIMKNHIGKDNSILGEKLFSVVYGHTRKPDYVDDFRWDYIRKAMHRLRQRTKLFIAHVQDKGKFYYYVPIDEQECQSYITLLDNNIKSMKKMQLKIVRSVNEKWYALDWIEENALLQNVKEINSIKKIK